MIKAGFLVACFLLLVRPTWAVTVSFTGAPETISYDQEVELNVSLNCSSCSDSYLRGVLYPGGTDYFGLTQNNSGNWIGTSSDKTQYYKVAKDELSEGSWSGRLKLKPDITDSSYTGSGKYYIKVGRYTTGGSVTWSDSTQVNLSGPAPTATVTPIPATATSTNKPTIQAASVTKFPTATKIPVTTIKPTSTMSMQITSVSEKVVSEVTGKTLASEVTKPATKSMENTQIAINQVLGAKDVVTSGTESVKLESPKMMIRLTTIVLLIMGLLSAAGAAGVFWIQYNKNKGSG